MVSLDGALQGRLRREYEQRLSDYRDALAHTVKVLDGIVAHECQFDDPSRARVEVGRIKGAASLLGKIERKYDAAPNSLDEVQGRILDILGTRITCKTRRDVYDVRNALLAASQKADSPVRIVEDFTDYNEVPKESGYRALHVVVVARLNRYPRPLEVPCEVQLRTLLQHAWGELTHENTYKPGSAALPEMFVTLSRHLSGLLHEVDELALSIAAEIDRNERDRLRGVETLERAEARASSRVRTGSGIDDLEGDHFTGVVTSVTPTRAVLRLSDGRTGYVDLETIRGVLETEDDIDVSTLLHIGDDLTVVPTSTTSDAGTVRLDLTAPAELRQPTHPASRPVSRQELLKRDGTRVSIYDLLDSGMLAPGDDLVFRRPQKGRTFRAKVTSKGNIRLSDGRTFGTPSRAAIVAAGVQSLDGWHAWQVPSRGNQYLHDLRVRWLQTHRAG